MKVPDIIYSQLGGNRFSVMTGAKDFKTSNGLNLIFNLPNNFANNNINLVEITLTPSDTYDYGFYYVKNKKLQFLNREKWKQIEFFSGVYAEDLESIFKSVTHLDTRL